MPWIVITLHLADCEVTEPIAGTRISSAAPAGLLVPLSSTQIKLHDLYRASSSFDWALCLPADQEHDQ
jgi:hypothetical protein